MSIQATSWAFEQRGLKPSAKLVLVYLADCHNGHTKRCDPMQTTLAAQCEMSRSGVNRKLNELEERGFIKRVQRSDKQTKRQKSTFYILGCDPDLMQDVDIPVSQNRTRDSAKAVSQKQPKPCPKNDQSRVPTVAHEPESKPEGTGAGAREASELDEIAKFWAERINAKKSVTASAIKISVAQRMLELGLVSEEDLRQRRIAW